MKNLWAPWRVKYITSAKDKNQGCFLCEKPKEKKDAENYVLYRGTTCFVLLNSFPYNNGHIMVAPYRHTGVLEDLKDEERDELFATVKQVVVLLKKVFNPDGLNIGMNLGKTAGAGLEDHLHVHIVPRWNGDTNFMPVIGEAKVISEALEETYRKLKAGLKQMK
jgi:ATP adenylyltransferase